MRRHSALRYSAECLALYGLPPLVLGLADAPRFVLFSFLYAMTLGCLIYVVRQPGFSWQSFWHGRAWPKAQKRAALLRFALSIPLFIGVTFALAPERFLRFPLERPGFWFVVMILYPLLSVVPQTIVFRSFFRARYEGKVPAAVYYLLSGLVFAFAHSMYGNWVSPFFTFFGGMLFTYSFRQHGSLKWSVLEHAAYGNAIFTLGIGWYFFKHAV